MYYISNKDSVDKMGFHKDMFFFISFSNQGDEVTIRTPSEMRFDFRTYFDKVQETYLQTILKKDPNLDTGCLIEGVEEYCQRYGYEETLSKLATPNISTESCFTPASLIKSTLRKALTKNNIDKAKKIVLRYKKFFDDVQSSLKYIRCIKLINLLQEDAPIDQIVKFMTSELTRYKFKQIKVVMGKDSQGELEFKVGHIRITRHLCQKY